MWAMDIVYANTCGIQCKLIWNTMSNVLSLGLPLLLIEDFNYILQAKYIDIRGGKASIK